MAAGWICSWYVPAKPVPAAGPAPHADPAGHSTRSHLQSIPHSNSSSLYVFVQLYRIVRFCTTTKIITLAHIETRGAQDPILKWSYHPRQIRIGSSAAGELAIELQPVGLSL